MVFSCQWKRSIVAIPMEILSRPLSLCQQFANCVFSKRPNSRLWRIVAPTARVPVFYIFSSVILPDIRFTGDGMWPQHYLWNYSCSEKKCYFERIMRLLNCILKIMIFNICIYLLNASEIFNICIYMIFNICIYMIFNICIYLLNVSETTCRFYRCFSMHIEVRNDWDSFFWIFAY